MFSWLFGLFSQRQKALAQYRSGMAKAKKDDFAGAINDYTATIRSSSVPDDIIAMALYNRALAYSATQEDGKAAEDLVKVLAMPRLPEKIRVAASQRQERIRRRELA